MVRSKVYSAIGELVWYLSGSDALAQIQYYIERYHEFSDDGTTLNGAYGPRIFSRKRCEVPEAASDEWQRVIDVLKARTGSRNAVIQIYSNADGNKKTNDIPCTCTLQFAIRRNKLEMHVHMRSNDAYLGLPHDVFSFTMMQEIAARELGVDVGRYQHSVASLHLYDDDEEPGGLKFRTLAQKYLDEGLHDTVSMPPMPQGDPWASIRELVYAEKQLRMGNLDYAPPSWLDPYWRDLIVLLRAYAMVVKDGAEANLEGLLDNIQAQAYHLYILDRIAKRTQPTGTKDFFKNDGEENTKRGA